MAVHRIGDRQVIIWTNADPIHRRIYAALGGDELTHHLPLVPHIFVFLSRVGVGGGGGGVGGGGVGGGGLLTKFASLIGREVTKMHQRDDLSDNFHTHTKDIYLDVCMYFLCSCP